MTGSSRDDTPPPEQSPRRPEQERGSTVSMTSTTTGLPDRYRPLDQVGPDEPTATGVIRSWRAKDRVLNRDVAIRVHTPAGPAAHAWISRALTAGGLATPALAMVYDASEGIGRPGRAPRRCAAYVVNEWIDGETLAERLARGPDARARGPRDPAAAGRGRRRGAPRRPGRRRPVPRQRRPPPQRPGRPAGRARRHRHHRRRHRRARRAAGGLPHRPRPRGARAATAHRLLRPHGARPPRPVHRAGPGAVQRRRHGRAAGRAPRSGSGARARGPPRRDGAGGHRQRLAAAAARPQGGRPRRGGRGPGGRRRAGPPGPAHAAPGARASGPSPPADAPLSAAALGGDTIDAGTVAPSAGAYAGPRPAGAPTRSWDSDDHDGPLGVLGDRPLPDYDDGYDDLPPEDEEDGAKRHRFVVIGLPLLALALVVALAWWIGNALLSVSGDIDDPVGSTPSASAPAERLGRGGPRPGTPVADRRPPSVFDPQGDGDPDHPEDVPLAYDGDPATAWATYEYRARRRSATSRTASACSRPRQRAGAGRRHAHQHRARRHRGDPHRRHRRRPSSTASTAGDGGHDRGRDRAGLRRARHGPLRAGLDHRPGAERGRLLRRPRRDRDPVRRLTRPVGGPAGGECRPYDPRCAARD